MVLEEKEAGETKAKSPQSQTSKTNKQKKLYREEPPN